ncbi:MAG: pyrroline-5-carboxylate reductase [Nitratireductor sp.]|nr:pyrroline-5-carboxylate reductase [Nitratireductor sp.]
MSDKDNFSLALLGAGNMGGAMLAGWLAQGFDPKAITVIDPAEPQSFKDKGVRVVAAPPPGLAPDVLVLAVKPQIMGEVLPAAARLCGADTVAVSVAAGQTIATIEAALGKGRAVVRTMPNTPALVGRGITAACPNGAVTPLQRHRVDRLLKAIGKVEWVEDEALIDAVTAVSGSGPAYVFHLVEALAAAGEKAGLPPALAAALARETVSGAGELLARSDLPPSRLRENVTSPKGTTAAALNVLMGEGGLTPLMERAVAAAHRRAMELGAK